MKPEEGALTHGPALHEATLTGKDPGSLRRSELQGFPGVPGETSIREPSPFHHTLNNSLPPQPGTRGEGCCPALPGRGPVLMVKHVLTLGPALPPASYP